MSTRLSHLIYRLSAVASSEPVSVEVWSSQVFVVFFWATEAHSVTLSFVKTLQQKIFWVLSSAGIYNDKEVPLFLILSLPLVATCIVYLVVFLIFICRDVLSWASAGVCLCAVHVPCWRSQVVRPLRTHVHMQAVLLLVFTRARL